MRPPGLEPLLLFHLVAETGSFAAAARRRGVTAQAVGQVIAGFEAQLGARLFHRTTRRLSLTEDGLLLRARTQAALGQISEAIDEVAARREDLAGKVRIAAPLVFGKAILAPMLFDVMTERPGLAIDLVLDDHDTDLVAGRIDIAFRAGAMRAGGGNVEVTEFDWGSAGMRAWSMPQRFQSGAKWNFPSSLPNPSRKCALRKPGVRSRGASHSGQFALEYPSGIAHPQQTQSNMSVHHEGGTEDEVVHANELPWHVRGDAPSTERCPPIVTED